MEKIVLGTRGSALAMMQTGQVGNILEKRSGIPVEIRVISTEGDQDALTPLAAFGGRGAFVTALESALGEGMIDAAVHSLKDLPSQLPPGFMLGASPFREDPRDALASRSKRNLQNLPAESIIGTGSIRRRMQLERLRPSLRYHDIRGNIETRIGKMNSGAYDAIVLAAAGLKRLGQESLITEYFPVYQLIPAPGQGAIGVECLDDRAELKPVMALIENPDIRVCVDAERLFISILGMGCHAPVGANACLDPEHDNVMFHAMAGTENGTMIHETLQASRENLPDAVRELAEKFRKELNAITIRTE